MPREHAVKPRERNAALIDVMLLAAMADGELTETAMQALIRRVLERPEFEGTRPEELNAQVERSARTLAGAKNLQEILASLRERLPDHKGRMLAFGLAAAIVLADQRATRAELGLLKTFQAALGISEDEVVRIIDAIEDGTPLGDATGQPLARLCAEVMVLVSAADGRLKDAEVHALVEALSANPLFREVSPESAQQYVSEAVSALAAEGLPQRLRVLTDGLATHAQRVAAFSLAMRIAHASGTPSTPELKILELLQATFGLADDEVERIRSQS